MTDLTEQWKKGELEDGWYYIEIDAPFEQRIKDISHYSLGSFDIDIDSNYITEVLSPVPSYDEWRELKEASDGLSKLMFKSLMNRFVKADEEKETQRIELMIRLNDVNNENHALEVENAKPKELLKECQHMILAYSINHDTFTKEKVIDIVKQIDEALK